MEEAGGCTEAIFEETVQATVMGVMARVEDVGVMAQGNKAVGGIGTKAETIEEGIGTNRGTMIRVAAEIETQNLIIFCFVLLLPYCHLLAKNMSPAR